MIDIIETLRDPRYIGQEGIRRLAADEIERLRAALKEIAENAFDAESAAFAREVLRAAEQKVPEGT